MQRRLLLQRFPATGRGVLRSVALFGIASSAGLVADLAVFSVLNLLGTNAVVANLVSTAIAITIAYLLVTRRAFDATATWRTYALFFTWYACSALVVSSSIGVLGRGQADLNLVWKFAFVPLTFCSNFLFSRWLFGSSWRRALWWSKARDWTRDPVQSVRLGPRATRYVHLVGDHPWRAGAVMTTAFFVFVFPMNNSMSFGAATDMQGVFREYATRSAFALCLLALARWGIGFSVGVLRHQGHHRRWLLASSVYFVLMMPIFVLIYPGHWVFDEFDTIYGATHWFPVAWQGYLTHVYYAFCLYLLPSKVGIVLIQITFLSIVAGYVVTVAAEHLRRPWLAGLVLVALLSPAVLLNNFYPLRLTAYGYLLLLVVIHLLRRSAGMRIPRAAEFFATTCAIAVLAFWRTEGVATLLLLPIAFVVLGMGALIRPAPARVLATTAAGLLVVSFSGWLSTATADPRYQFTAMINPISTMLQGDLQGPNTAADLSAFDAVIDIDRVATMPSYTETPAFWAVGLRPEAEKHAGAFRGAYLDLVIHNPALFLENRWNTFIAANSLTTWAPQVQIGGINGSSPAAAEKFAAFEASTPFGHALDLQVKYQTARHLFLLNSALQPTPLTTVVWNSIPSIVVLSALLGLALVRRRWVFAGCAMAVLGGAALVFLSEPASYFMYFFPVYLVGLVGGAVVVATAVDRLLASRREAQMPVMVMCHEVEPGPGLRRGLPADRGLVRSSESI